MPLRSDWTSERCPIARSLEVLGDPWVMLVLRQAFSGVRRFEQFRDQLGVQPGAADKVRLLAIASSSYGDNLRMKIHDTSQPEIVLNDAVFLVGAGAIDMLGAQPDKILFLNSLGHEVTIEILVGRLAT